MKKSDRKRYCLLVGLAACILMIAVICNRGLNQRFTCRIHVGEFPLQVYLLCVNTGMFYSLDASDEETDEGGVVVSFGQDAVSGSNVRTLKEVVQKKCDVKLQRGKGTIDMDQIEAMFCEDCRQRLLSVIQDREIQEFVIYDACTSAFYAVEEGALQIRDWNIVFR